MPLRSASKEELEVFFTLPYKPAVITLCWGRQAGFRRMKEGKTDTRHCGSNVSDELLIKPHLWRD